MAGSARRLDADSLRANHQDRRANRRRAPLPPTTWSIPESQGNDRHRCRTPSIASGSSANRPSGSRMAVQSTTRLPDTGRPRPGTTNAVSPTIDAATTMPTLTPDRSAAPPSDPSLPAVRNATAATTALPTSVRIPSHVRISMLRPHQPMSRSSIPKTPFSPIMRRHMANWPR